VSMFTPRGEGARPLRRRRRRTGAVRRVALVAVALLVLVSLAVLAWQTRRDDEPTDRSAPRKTCPAPTPLPSAVAPAKIKVNVYNATDHRGLAAEVAGQLDRRGFTVRKVDNDPLKRTVTGLAEVRHSSAGDGAARTVAAQVGTVVSVPDQRPNGSVDLVLGADFDHLLTRAEAAAVLSPSPTPAPADC
jgi:hypothetical protein